MWGFVVFPSATFLSDSKWNETKAGITQNLIQMKLQTLKSLSIHCVNKKWDVCKLPWHGLQSLVHKKAAQWMPNATEVNKKKPLALYSSFILLQLLHRYNTPDKIDG